MSPQKRLREIRYLEDRAQVVLPGRAIERVAIIDLEDVAEIAHRAWHYHCGYAACSENINGRVVNTFLHRVLLPPPPGKFVDHINHDKLDNRRANLRLVSGSENLRNRRLASGGVHHRKDNDKWRVTMTIHGKRKFYGNYDTKEEAMTVRRALELELFGEFAAKDDP